MSRRRMAGVAALGMVTALVAAACSSSSTTSTGGGGGNSSAPSSSSAGFNSAVNNVVATSTHKGGTQIWTMLADGTQVRQLTTAGKNQQPNWSFK